MNGPWGFANLVRAYLLLARVGRFDVRALGHAVSVGVGMLLMAIFTARTFGRLHGGLAPLR